MMLNVTQEENNRSGNPKWKRKSTRPPSSASRRTDVSGNVWAAPTWWTRISSCTWYDWISGI